MDSFSSNKIYTNKILLDKKFFEEKCGIINGLTYASAQYIYKVFEKHNKQNIKWFESSKIKKLKRTIIHKNAHLDEYFAELIFRAILPPHLKDIEVCEHVLMSSEDDSFAKISWPNGVVFGIHSDETGGAKALAFFDEHNPDGNRLKPSCSQLVIEEFLGNNVPNSLKKILEEVNYYDSHAGAHTFNLKNIFFSMHDILMLIGKNEVDNTPVTKYLTENWKRGIVNASIVAIIYIHENNLLSDNLTEEEKIALEKVTKKSLDFFISKTVIQSNNPQLFELVKKDLLRKFKVWDNTAKEKEPNPKHWHQTIDGAFWKDQESGEKINQQVFILQILCYALHKCWGDNIANLVMIHIWQIIFQDQIAFWSVVNELSKITIDNQKITTSFGSIEKVVLNNLTFSPVQKKSDKVSRNLKLITSFWIYDITVTNPTYPNVKKAIMYFLNKKVNEKGNDGFGIFILHDKIFNSKSINCGSTFPYELWVQLSGKIILAEPERWFQLKNLEGNLADFILNRTKAHQESLPSEIVDKNFIINTIQTLKIK